MALVPTLDQYASKVWMLYEGEVKEVEKVKSAKNTWFTLIHVRGQRKPLALHEDWQGTIPKRGDHISVEANEAAVWFFPKHHDIVVTPKVDYEQYIVKQTIPETDMEKAMEIIRIRLRESSPDPDKRQVCGDDVYDDLADLMPDRDPRIFGVPFQKLAKRGEIHFFGYKKSVRIKVHHQTIAVWHEGLKQ